MYGDRPPDDDKRRPIRSPSTDFAGLQLEREQLSMPDRQSHVTSPDVLGLDSVTLSRQASSRSIWGATPAVGVVAADVTPSVEGATPAVGVVAADVTPSVEVGLVDASSSDVHSASAGTEMRPYRDIGVDAQPSLLPPVPERLSDPPICASDHAPITSTATQAAIVRATRAMQATNDTATKTTSPMGTPQVMGPPIPHAPIPHGRTQNLTDANIVRQRRGRSDLDFHDLVRRRQRDSAEPIVQRSVYRRRLDIHGNPVDILVQAPVSMPASQTSFAGTSSARERRFPGAPRYAHPEAIKKLLHEDRVNSVGILTGHSEVVRSTSPVHSYSAQMSMGRNAQYTSHEQTPKSGRAERHIASPELTPARTSPQTPLVMPLSESLAGPKRLSDLLSRETNPPTVLSPYKPDEPSPPDTGWCAWSEVVDRLSREGLEVDIQRLRALFFQFSELRGPNHAPTMTALDLARALEAIDYSVTSDWVAELFKAMDSKREGQVEESEFIGGLLAASPFFKDNTHLWRSSVPEYLTSGPSHRLGSSCSQILDASCSARLQCIWNAYSSGDTMTVTDLSRLLGSLAREQRSPVPSLTQSPSLLKVRSCEVDYLALAQNPERYRRGGLASPTWVRRHPSPLSDLPSHTLPSNISGSNENTLFVEPRDIFRSTNDQRSSVEWDVEPSDKLHNDRTVDAVDLLDNRGPRPPLAGHSDPGPSPSLSKETETPQRPKQPRGTPGFVDGYRINPKLPPGVPDSNELMLAKSKLRAQEKPAEDKSSASLIFDGVDNQALLRPSEYKHQATIPISSGRSLFSSESISWSSKKNVGVTDGALDAQRTVRFPIETPVDSPQLPTVEVTTSRRRWPLLKKTTEVTRTPLTSVRDRKAPKPPKRQWTFHSAHGMPPASPLYLNRPRFQLLASPSSPLNSPHSANAAQITNAQRILDAFDGEFTYNAFLQVVALGWLRGTSRLYRLEDCPVLALREAINRAGHLHYQKQYEMGETFDDKEDRTPRAINIFSPLISIGCGRKAATDDRQPTPGPPTRISPLTDQPSSPVNQFRQGASVGVAAADGLRVQSPVYPVAAADGLRVQSPVYPVANCRSMDQRFIEGCQRDQPNLWDMVRIHENKGTIPRIPQVSTYLPPNVPTDCLTHPAGATEERQGHARVVVSPLHRKQAISSDEGSSESLASFPLETHPQLPPRLLASTPSSSPLRLSWFNCKSRDVSLNLEGGNPEAESPSDNTLLQFVMPTPTRPVQLESPLPKPALSLHFERCSPGSFDGSVKASSDSDLASLVDGMLLAPVLSSANLFSRPSSEVIDRAIFKADSISYLELEVLLTQLVDVCRSQPLLPCIRHMGGCCFVGSAGSDAWDQPVAGGLTPEDALQRTDLLLVAAFGIHSPADTRSMLRLISLKARYPGRVYILRCRTAVTAITSEVIVGKGAVPPSLLFHDAFEFLPLGLLLSRPNCTLLKGDVDFSDPVRLASITSNRQLIRTPEDELLRNIFDVAPVVHVSRGSHLYLKPH